MRRAIAIGIALAIALSGCAGRTPDALVSQTTTATTAQTQTPDVTPTPTATPIARTGLTPPTPIFGGDCSKLFTDEEMSGIAGETMRPFVYDDNGQGDPLHRQLGVITCDWVGDGSTAISLTVLHDEFASSVPEQTCGSFTSGENMFNKDLCVIDATSHGVRIGGAIYWPSHRESRTIADRLVTEFHADNLSELAGPAPSPSAGSWTARIVCEDVPPVVIDGTEFTFGTEIMGSDASILPVDDAIYNATPTSNGCYAKGEGDSPQFSFSSLGGGAWRYDEVLDLNFSPGQSPEPVEVPGFDFGFRAEGSMYLVSGPNYLSVWTSGEGDDTEIAVAVKRLLDAATLS